MAAVFHSIKFFENGVVGGENKIGSTGLQPYCIGFCHVGVSTKSIFLRSILVIFG